MLKFFYTTAPSWEGREVHYACGYEHLSKDTLAISFARCSPNDVFNKEKARLICAGRMCKGKFVEVEKSAKGTYDTIIKAIAEHEQKVQEAYGTR